MTTLRTQLLTLVCCVVLAGAGVSAAEKALPIIPGAHGFGITTPAGSGRHLDAATLQPGWDKDLIAHWDFDDGKPGGTLQGNAALAPNGKGKALKLSGKGLLSLAKPGGYVKPEAGFTLMAWARYDKPLGAVAQNAVDGGGNWYLGHVRHGIQKWMFGCKGADGTATHAIRNGDSGKPVWRHMAAVYDGATGAMHFYINASEIARTGKKVVKALPAAASANLSLGNGMTGMIDDVMLFGAPLAQEQILAVLASQYTAYEGVEKTTVYKVTNLKTEGPGSLREALDAIGPRVVVFEVSGNIDFTPFGGLSIVNPYVTVAGQTAPSPGITLKGCELGISTHDVLLQHIRIRAGDESKTGKTEKNASGWTQFSERDCVKVDGRRIVLDHCTFSWATDELVQSRASHITFRRNLFAEALSSPKHHKGTHSKALIILDQGSRDVTIPEEERNSQYIAVIDNLFAFNGDRNPVAQGCAKLVVANNFVYAAQVRPFIGMSLGLMPERGSRGGTMLASLQGNSFDRVPRAIRLIVRNGSVGKVYLGELLYTDNDKETGKVVTEHITDPWTAPHMLIFKEWIGKPIYPLTVKVDAPPIAIPGYEVKPSSAVRDFVLKHAGARPSDRSETDARVVQLVRDRKGKVPGTLADIGGWPTLPENRRELTLPENPGADDDGDGYTNLEEWLHAYASEVEERAESNDLERFKAVVAFEKPDYWPIMRLRGLGGIYPRGREKLVREGMPESVGDDIETWCDYWGLLTVLGAGSIGVGAPGIGEETHTEGEFEFVRYETGALTRQVLDNDQTYSMPDFQEFHVRDRESWETYKRLTTPTAKDERKFEELVARHTNRDKPLCIKVGGSWGVARNFLGPERALMMLYDDPELMHDIISHLLWIEEEFTFPVVRALKPEILHTFEDLCYKSGMMLSPSDFKAFCGGYYRRVAALGAECGALLLNVDCDGKVDQFSGVLDNVGFNGICPMEQACGNEVAEYREKFPRMIFSGGVEKGMVTTGDKRDIRAELEAVIPKRLAGRGYFPMFDHRLQPTTDFKRLCHCMTVLHELCGSTAGDFPRRNHD